MLKDFFDRDYFEAGLETGKSCYQNYKWMPEETVSLAMRFIDHFNLSREDLILDYGCSKGYLVKAFRLLHRRAFGFDISEYAISQVPKEVKDFCWSDDLLIKNFKLCIAKDVFEHVPLLALQDLLVKNLKAEKLFAVIPLGEKGVYRSRVNNLDPSHIVCYSEMEWMKFFEDTKQWVIDDFSFSFEGLKEHHPKESHGFFTLRHV